MCTTMEQLESKTEFDYSKLLGRIVEKFRTQSAFADALGIAKQTVNAKIQGNIEITKQDIVKWSTLLEIPLEEIGVYFFKTKV